MHRIVMVDDDSNFLKVYSKILNQKGYEVETSTSGEEALKVIKDNFFNIAIVDIMMPKMNGIELLKILRKEYPSLIVIILTGEGSIEGAVEAMKLGAHTYISKPVNIENLLNNVEKATEFYKLNSENISLKDKERDYTKSSLLGSSKFVTSTIEKIEKAAPSNATVLISGESGTGKEIIADLIHQKSKRKNGPFIKVNCGALSETVLESELFGYDKGAFTGAIKTKHGRFEMANGGTLFLDEIGDISLNLQQKLLRVIQEKEFERVGGVTTIHSDFRLICATNKELEKEVNDGNFREDLYYRINVIPLTTEPLRYHKEDIPVLFESFLGYYCQEMNRPEIRVEEDLYKVMKRYSWKGNVRELKNLAERAVVLSSKDRLTLKDMNYLADHILGEGSADFTSNYHKAEKSFQKVYITKKLLENDWNITKTASKIDISRKTLQLKIKELQIEKE